MKEEQFIVGLMYSEGSKRERKTLEGEKQQRKWICWVKSPSWAGFSARAKWRKDWFDWRMNWGHFLKIIVILYLRSFVPPKNELQYGNWQWEKLEKVCRLIVAFLPFWAFFLVFLLLLRLRLHRVLNIMWCLPVLFVIVFSTRLSIIRSSPKTHRFIILWVEGEVLW